MANEDLKTFLEDRLKALDPSLDLESGSPAQVDFIEPVLRRLGTDPFETDIQSFIADRFQQEFPDIYAGDPSVIRDVFVNPLIMLLEPFKRETQLVRRNQSLQDPSVLADEEADALVANIFESRSTGGFSVGTVRVFFPNPTNVNVEITARFFTGNGLGFYPTNPVALTAEEMLFNTSGSLFYMDVPVRAEQEGAEYNVDPDSINGADGVFGWVRVTNTRKFRDGTARVDTPTFVAAASEALNERSLVTRRGAISRLNNVFQGEMRAIQIIGAKDTEMQRDILIAASPGHAWLTGVVNLSGKLAYVQCRTIEGEETDSPAVGDTLYFYLPKTLFAGVPQSERFVRLTVEEVLLGPMAEIAPFQVSYLVRWSGSLPAGVSIDDLDSYEGGFSKKGTVRVSSLPDFGETSITVPNAEVHIYGHTDVYVRPVLQPVSKSVLDNLMDSKAQVERLTLSTNGGDVSNKNRVGDTNATFDFIAAGVSRGDILVIETGNDAGNYRICDLTTQYLFLHKNLTVTATGLRYRILKRIRIDPFEPKVKKFPFGSVPANDLSTTIGSNLFTLASNDMLDYGVRVGDTIRVTSGDTDEGDFTITGFDTVLGGRGLLVDRVAGGSNSSVTYEIFTGLEAIERPLVRIRELLLLDSARQSTGITVPPAGPVAVVPTCSFTSAQVRGFSQRSTGFIVPDLTALGISGGNGAAPSGDRRYSMGFDPFTGVYRSMAFANGTYAEFDFRSDANGSCSYFISCTESFDDNENFPPISPSPGECLTIKSGPNKGSYLIDSVNKFKHRDATGKSIWTYFIKIHGTFPVDVMKYVIDFLNDAEIAGAVGAGFDEIGATNNLAYPSFFVNAFEGLGAKLHTALAFYGASSPGASSVQEALEDLALVNYEWGDPARGTLRSYFLEPTLFEQWTAEADETTTYNYKTGSGEVLKFRPEPSRYQKHELVPARLLSDTDPLNYPRDLNASVAAEATFTDSARATAFLLGLKAGDVLSVHEEIFFHGATKAQQTAVQVQTGSSHIFAPDSSGDIFTEDMVGNMVYLEEGVDAGAYRVTGFVGPRELVLDQPMSEATPTILLSGSGANWGYDGGLLKNVLEATIPAFVNAHVNLYLTLYGMNSSYQGSYKIKSLVGASPTAKVELERAGTTPLNFPALPADAGLGRWVVTAAPVSNPTVVGGATALHGLRPIRMYDEVPSNYEITSVTTSPTTSHVGIAAGLKNGHEQPFRIYRKNVRRVNPTEMNENQDGSLFYFDTEVISLGASTAHNIHKEAYLTIEKDSYLCDGYVHNVEDNTRSYSMEEEGTVDIPTQILPIGSADSQDNYINLVGAPLQARYERAEIVKQFQEFLESVQDRVTVANLMARHFLPSYASYEASYSGGSSPSVIAKDIQSYIDSLPVEQPIDISEIEKKIIQRGGNPETPTKVVAVIHDWDRKAWAEFNENKLGGSETEVPYNGTPRVSYFVPGPDTSGQDPQPMGERITLTRL